MKVNKSYHTNIKVACKMGILEPQLLEQIPKSTQYRFRNADYSHIFGAKEIQTLENNSELIQELIKYKKLLAVNRAIIKVKNTLFAIKDKNLSQLKKIPIIIHTIESIQKTVPFTAALRFFSISKTTYYNWKHQVLYPCYDSFIAKCVKRWPNQLSRNTANKIKEICANPLFSGWPLASIAYYAKREKLLSLSLATWYKYAKLLHLTTSKMKSFKKYKIGIRAAVPNQLWHADVTIFKTMDNIKHYIYIVIDNFSRKILSYAVSDKNRADIRLDTLKEAYSKYGYSYKHDDDIMLLVDGGSENNNKLVDGYVNQETISIKKIIAQKDIHFSNSMVEAYNKILKYNWLYQRELANGHALKEYLSEAINVYNKIRPHYSLKGLTPNEAFAGKTKQMIFGSHDPEAEYRKRIAENRQSSCSLCE